MAKSTKTPAPRKPVKARGALPSPKTAPPRAKLRWYRRPGWQLVAIAVGIALIGGLWAGGGAWLKNRHETKTNTRAVTQFDRRYSVLKSPVSDVISAITQKTSSLSTGSPAGPEFQKDAEGWLKELRRMDSQLRQRTIPPGLPELDQARGVLVEGYLTYIDAVKVLSLTTGAADPVVKLEGVREANSIIAHAASIVTTGEALLTRIKVEMGIRQAPQGQTSGQPALNQPLQLPPEDAPAPSGQAAQTGAAGVPSGSAAGVPPTTGGSSGGTAPPAAP